MPPPVPPPGLEPGEDAKPAPEAPRSSAGLSPGPPAPIAPEFESVVTRKPWRKAKSTTEHGVHCAYRNVAPSGEMVADPAAYLSYTVDMALLCGPHTQTRAVL